MESHTLCWQTIGDRASSLQRSPRPASCRAPILGWSGSNALLEPPISVQLPWRSMAYRSSWGKTAIFHHQRAAVFEFQRAQINLLDRLSQSSEITIKFAGRQDNHHNNKWGKPGKQLSTQQCTLSWDFSIQPETLELESTTSPWICDNQYGQRRQQIRLHTGRYRVRRLVLGEGAWSDLGEYVTTE